jgi:hypothetical protein
MTLARRWALAAAALAALLVAACVVGWALVPSDAELARRLEAEFEARLGQKLAVGAVRWRVLGVPEVEVLDARTRQTPAIEVRRLAIRPQLMPLLRRQLVIDRLEVDGAVVPRDALTAFRGQSPGGAGGAGGAVVLRSVVFTDVTYISYSGVPVVYEGEIDLDEDRLPGRVQVRRPGVEPPVSLDARRDGRTDGAAHRYQLRLRAGGGSANGQARLATSDDGRMVLQGELAPRGVDVASLMAAFHRRSFVGGLASGETELRAEGETAGELFRSLRTRSVLEVERARILRLDLDKAIKTLGQDRAGQTPLDSLSGVMATRNTEQGHAVPQADRCAGAAGHRGRDRERPLCRKGPDARAGGGDRLGVAGRCCGRHGHPARHRHGHRLEDRRRRERAAEGRGGQGRPRAHAPVKGFRPWAWRGRG